ncbi:putative selenate reductase subunit YgfK [Collinsella tanakaei]|uniref:putative selenate reductase subunit YgfK n=1 Tax=Collinsella tanakaei TaxID=626935 RepID=UPI00195969A4|nr:putative selenate reductase subunit YgfK [Collinsella tanakaei]MBM6756243.1 putative selenate reductase subunit YgfK [Collinsella tanakaei]MBM6867113.1 putative selenate reductase subunit YgfK [Collinsella tanakaei]
MSDIMRPIPFASLMNWVMTEHEQTGSIFGVRKIVHADPAGALPIFDEKVETPFGPAAGPNTQLAQNIIAAYVAGSRFFELKTVQVMDGAELSACVNKPCITAADECYNCEWSTELEVPQAYAEYVKAWFACHLIAREYGLGSPDGFVFNMSVGYDLEGIKSPKVDAYIEGMKDASGSEVWAECRAWALENLDRFEHVDAAFIDSIPARVSNSITESTLHGCPPDEIERIATYLICEKNLNTYIKCNPTLLGYDFARARLDELGFDYIAFDDRHFVEDLQWADAVPMFERLMALTAERGLDFGVKLTNTFPVDVTRGELPSDEMYMSGRTLFSLTIEVARRITEQFGGALRISYSGGATIYNIRSLYDAGIWPITMATDVLKPGGYERMSQIAGEFAHLDGKPFAGVSLDAVTKIQEDSLTNPLYRNPLRKLPSAKVPGTPALVDCFTAPCRTSCPISQDIPAYLAAVDEGRFADALDIIIERNALPHITGVICPHPCGKSCERAFYEPEGAQIRASKLRAAREAFAEVLPQLRAKAHEKTSERNVAVVGGGPAGLACAYFLTRAGVPVTIFEERDTLGGIVRHVIPEFRIESADIDADVELCRAFGAEVKTGVRVESVAELKEQGFSDVVVATGAWLPGSAGLDEGAETDVLEFLEAAKKAPETLDLGTDVVVIGAGNTAMDAARAAKRIAGVENVRLVYRRTKAQMPADEEELDFALADGVEFMELLAPVSLADGGLTCNVMRLGEPDASGRRAPEPTGETVIVPATTVICAVGERIDTSLYEGAGVGTDRRGRLADVETGVAGVWAAGDCRRGPATVVEAIADAAEVARKIADVDFNKYVDANEQLDRAPYVAKKGALCRDKETCTHTRCLGCGAVCEVCCDVCPNRANIAIAVPGMDKQQVIHVDGMCNECGNCAVFCPYETGRPYKDKLTLFWSGDDMLDSDNDGFMKLADGTFSVRLAGEVHVVDIDDASSGVPDGIRRTIAAVRDDYGYLFCE